MSESNVVDFPGTTTLATSPEKVLSKATEAGLSDVLVLGYIDKGDGEYECTLPDQAPISRCSCCL